jgi:hypothetical protein
MDEIKKERGLLLTSWLFLMLLINIGGALIYLLLGIFYPNLIPTIPSWAIYFFGISEILMVVFIIFLFKWKKWAFFALCGMAIIALIINLIIGVGFTSILGLIGVVILYLLLRSKWDLLE